MSGFSSTRIAAVLALLSSSPAATIVVSGSIEAAVTRAAPGDTILIPGPNVYHEHLVIEKEALSLLGTNSPIIDGSAAGTPVTLKAPKSQIRNVTIRNGGCDLGNFDSGIMLNAPGTTAAQCRIEGGGFGIYIHGVDNCRVEGNQVFGNTNLVASNRGNGVHLWKTRGNIISGNFISGTRDGAYFSYADKNLILSNRIEQTRFGIHYMYSHENRLAHNTFTANAVGAALMFARHCEVEGNIALANRRHGILLKQVETSRFIGNVVCGQNRGFFVQQAAQNRFENNLIEANDIGLYLSNGSEQNVFTGNAFIRNTDQVWQPQGEVEMGRLASNDFADKHRGNYWSDYTGADANGDGIGDTPYHETDVYGYLVDRYPAARVFALSPAVALLRKGEELLPVLNSAGITDPFPLQNVPASVAAFLRASQVNSRQILTAKR